MDNSKMMNQNGLCVGIDLGTTNSVLATVNVKLNGDLVSKVVEIPRPIDVYNSTSEGPKLSTCKKTTLPSFVYYRQDKGYEPLVGDFAKVQYPLRPHLVAKSIKSQMGNDLAVGLSPDIPDKTPSEISSRILKHLLREASNIYKRPITEAVITVPANFDSAMCKATRDAAEIAGIEVRNPDGSEKPVLLSEPNAVIYDLINQIRNGEISDCVLDLSSKKLVLVFDLGGGTLDITMHEIERREDNKEILKVNEIATNRYTLLGGDDFDNEIAKAMYARYIKQYNGFPAAVAQLQKNQNVIMPQLRVYAENLKLDLNEKCSSDYDSGWDDPDDEISIPIGGNMGGIGYSYDDTFTKDEVEQILSVFMANDLRYDDYKRIEKITNTRNIIYPILDVLKKASQKFGVADVKVDAVIVNGGMSKFYMVTDRLKDFFGFDPIVSLDPDLSVARGAALYHYYMRKYEEMKDDMKFSGQGFDSEKPSFANASYMNRSYERKVSGGNAAENGLSAENTARSAGAENGTAISGISSRHGAMAPIQWGNNILNDSLYLGVKNGAVQEIIPTGAELPYVSAVMTGFMIEPGQYKIAVPIKSRNIDGTYRTIAIGDITFKQKYPNGAYVAFIIHMGSNKVITMRAWTGKDISGQSKIEEGYANIVISNGNNSKFKAGGITPSSTRFVAPSGTKLEVKNEINTLLQLMNNRKNGKAKKGISSKQIATCVSHICSAGNKEEFAPAVLEQLQKASDDEIRQRFFVIARKLGTAWSDQDKKELASICMSQLGTEINGFSMGAGPQVSTNIQAIYTLSICGSQNQLGKLSSLHDNPRYLQALLYTHGKTHSELKWIVDEFEDDAVKSLKGIGNNIQFSSFAAGIALSADYSSPESADAKGKIVKKLCEVMDFGTLSDEELTCCILALGCICNQINVPSEIDPGIIKTAGDAVKNVVKRYPLGANKQLKACAVADKMISGQQLTSEEEEFLLTKLEQ